MSKKLTISLLVAVVAVTLLVSTVVFAQGSDATLNALYEQIDVLRRQVIEREVELGYLTEEDGERMLELMEERSQQRLEEGSGRFFGMHGRGWGRGDGLSRGYGHCWDY